jgi:hypothetical protein
MLQAPKALRLPLLTLGKSARLSLPKLGCSYLKLLPGLATKQCIYAFVLLIDGRLEKLSISEANFLETNGEH